MKIKGTSISSFLAFLDAEFGPTRAREFVAYLEPGLRKRCEALILASAFYPIEELDALLRQAREFFSADSSFFERSGAHNASFGLAGVHQALLTRPAPADLLKAAERSWGQFVDSGAVTVDLPSDGKASVRIEGLPGSEVFCPRTTGFLNRSLQIAGAQRLSVRKARCTLASDSCCEWDISWDADASPRTQSLTIGIRRPTSI